MIYRAGFRKGIESFIFILSLIFIHLGIFLQKESFGQWISSGHPLIKSIAQPVTKYNPIDIPMRDGNVLAADLYSIDTTVAKPVILIQTPYNKNLYRLAVGIPPQAGGSPFPYDSVNYNYVILDWRGFYGSKKAAVTGYDRGLDGYDAVEWIASQRWCNGKVGTWGPSALGVIQFQTAKHHPPHLVCSVPLVKDFKMKYSDYYYGGVFRKEHVEALVKLGFFSSTQLILDHPSEDIFWLLAQISTDYPDSIDVPMLLISGWFDHFPDDVIRAFDDLRKRSDPKVRAQHKLMMGPWLHSGVDKDKQGELTYPNVLDVANDRALQFFAYYLQGAKNGYPILPPVQYYQMGTNEWHTTSDWYSLGSKSDTLYLGENNLLSTTAPLYTSSFDSLRYDPRDPSPAVGGSRFDPFDRTILMGPQDIRQQIESRSDALIYSTSVLQKDLVVTGSMNVQLFISSDRKDTDFSVRLCDVYPDGRSMIMTQGIRRARFRNSYSTEELMNPGQIYPVTVELQHIAMTFLKGHQLRIVVSSSDYPHFDINLNNGGPLYKPGDTLVATNYIYHDATHPSRVLFSHPPITEVSEQPITSLEEFILMQNYPNPFNMLTTICFRLREGERVTLRVYNSIGCEVATLVNGELDRGEHQIKFDAGPLPHGMYSIQLRIGERIKTKRMILMK